MTHQRKYSQDLFTFAQPRGPKMLQDFFKSTSLESPSSLSILTVETSFTWIAKPFEFPSKKSMQHLGNVITQGNPYLSNDILCCNHILSLLSWDFTYPRNWLSAWTSLNQHLQLHKYARPLLRYNVESIHTLHKSIKVPKFTCNRSISSPMASHLCSFTSSTSRNQTSITQLSSHVASNWLL